VTDPLSGFSPDELHRYARHLSLQEVGVEGQRRLKEARVLVVGAGGLGSPASLYLAAAGVGRLGVIDGDVVELSNLQRQVLHATGAVGQPKVDSARARLEEVNPHVSVVTHPFRLTAENAMEVVAGYDLVVDGSDNFATRYLVNDAAVLSGKPWVYGAILRWEGQVSLFGAPGGPCYRCLFREPPPPGLVPGCAEAGVIGALPGAVGSLQALEAVKWILGLGRGGEGRPASEGLHPFGARSAAGRLLILDTLRFSFRTVEPRRDPDCPLCGDAPTIRELVDYEWFCATGETREATAAGAAESQGPAAVPGEPPPPGPAAGGPASDPIPTLTPTDLQNALTGGAPPVLVDVREDWEWAVSSLADQGAIHLPLKVLERRLEDEGDGLPELPRDRDLVLYCRSGARSDRGARLLRAAGFPRVQNLEGGMEGWARELAPHLPVA
jgi:sulfur-carrier protein adenylyltransferase/sulfurtransferase